MDCAFLWVCEEHMYFGILTCGLPGGGGCGREGGGLQLPGDYSGAGSASDSPVDKETYLGFHIFVYYVVRACELKKVKCDSSH